MKAPDHASRLKSRFMRSEEAYELVFSESVDLNIWPKIGLFLKMTDAFLNTIRSEYDRGDRFLKSRRQFVCFITISRMLGTFNFNEKDLLLFDLNKYSHKELTTTWELINDLDITLELKPTKRNTKNYLIKLCILAQDEWNIQNLERIKKRKAIRLNYRSGKGSIRNVTKNKVNLDFALKVNMLLPKQPWKPGIDREIIDKLSCTRLEYFFYVILD